MAPVCLTVRGVVVFRRRRDGRLGWRRGDAAWGMGSCRTGPASGVIMGTNGWVAPGTMFAAGSCPPAAFDMNIWSAVIREICGSSRSDGQSPMVAALR